MLKLAATAMRTRFEILLADEDRDPADLRAAGEEALAEIELIESRLSVYRPDAALYTLNAQAYPGPVPVDAPSFALLAQASRLWEATDGAFDMTVGPLLACWGLAGEAEGRVPTDAEIAAARERIGMGRVVRLEEASHTVAFAVPGVRLDPGAIGKGYALERARDLLREAGIRRALLHGGTSTVCALGTPPGNDAWRIALQHPLRPEAHLAEVALRDGEALGVSAVHGKTFWAESRRFGHILDPRSGRPVEDTLLSAVVLPDATEADAVSTALLVHGRDGLDGLTQRFPEARLLVASAPEAQVTTVGEWGGVAAAPRA